MIAARLVAARPDAVLELGRGERQGPPEEADEGSGRDRDAGPRLDDPGRQARDEGRPPNTRQHAYNRDEQAQDHGCHQLHGCRLQVFDPLAEVAASAVSIAAYWPLNQVSTRLAYHCEAGFSLWPPG
jgi:hypothetical protein